MIEPRPPAELDWLTEIVGAEGVLALIEAAGGTEIYVPATLRDDHPLVAMLGAAAAAALAKERGGAAMRVPLAKTWRAWVYRARGMTHAAIARKLGCQDITVIGMMRARPETRQIALPLPTPRRPDPIGR